MQRRTRIAVTASFLLAATGVTGSILPDSMLLADSILRDLQMMGWPVVALLSIFATPAGYSEEERRATPTSRLWWTYLFLLPPIPLGLVSLVWLFYWA